MDRFLLIEISKTLKTDLRRAEMRHNFQIDILKK